MHTRRHLCAILPRIQSDNAIFTPKSHSLAFLKENGAEVTHGLPFVSRCQSQAERTIGKLMRLVTKFHTDSPSSSFEQIVEEATLMLNSYPTDGLPNGWTPRELMFTRPTRSFIHSRAEEADITTGPLSIRNAIKAARAAKGATLEHRVSTFLKTSKRNTATNYTRRLKPGDYVLRKRTNFPSNTPRKLCFKIKLDGYEIISCVATNAFKMKLVMTGLIETLAGDLLI